MDKAIKAITIGSIHKDLFFNKSVSISFDDLSFDSNCDYKVLVQIEPPSIMDFVDKIPSNKNNFDLILAWHPKVLSLCENSVLFPFGSCWIEESNRIVHKKNKNTSIIASGKKTTEGHRLRHDIIRNNSTNIDVYGTGYNPVQNKITALKDYRFSIVIENDSVDNWFTEKIIDCLVTGTVPIYWGCNNIGDYFDINGFIIIKNIDDFERIIPSLNVETYNRMLPFVMKNFEKSLNYVDFWGRIEDTINQKLINKYGNK